MANEDDYYFNTDKIRTEAFKAAARAREKEDLTNDPTHPKVSKWLSQNPQKRTEHDFLHLIGTKEDYQRHIKNFEGPGRIHAKSDDKTVGTLGTYNEPIFDLMKRCSARIKHVPKDRYKTIRDRNFLVLPPIFSEATTLGMTKEMTHFYESCAHRILDNGNYRWKQPWEYSKILMDVTMTITGDDPRDVAGAHAFLVVTYSDLKKRTTRVVTHDVMPHLERNEPTYEHILGQYVEWLKSLNPPDKWTFAIEYCKDQPEQHDGWNCGEYMYAFSKAIMKGNPPTEQFLPPQMAIPSTEPLWDCVKGRPGASRIYMKGRTDRSGTPMHPCLDKLVEYMNDKRNHHTEVLIASLKTIMIIYLSTNPVTAPPIPVPPRILVQPHRQIVHSVGQLPAPPTAPPMSLWEGMLENPGRSRHRAHRPHGGTPYRR
jgi:hypothetical protein